LTLVRRNRKSILTVFAAGDFQLRQFEIAPERRAANGYFSPRFRIDP
jgi:hypothetical protein